MKLCERVYFVCVNKIPMRDYCTQNKQNICEAQGGREWKIKIIKEAWKHLTSRQTHHERGVTCAIFDVVFTYVLLDSCDGGLCI